MNTDNAAPPEEESIPPTKTNNNDDTKGKNRLTTVSKQWDVENKGFLTDGQQKLRALDTDGKGMLSAAQLSSFAGQYDALRKENQQIKRGLIALVFLTCVFFVGTVVASVLAVKANKDTSIDVETGRMLVKNSDLPVTMHSQGISIDANEKATPDGRAMCASMDDIAKMFTGFSEGSQVRLHLNRPVDSEDDGTSEGVVVAPQESTSYYNDTHIVIGGIEFDISPENPCNEVEVGRVLQEVYGGKHRKLFRDALDHHRAQRQLNGVGIKVDEERRADGDQKHRDLLLQHAIGCLDYGDEFVYASVSCCFLNDECVCHM